MKAKINKISIEIVRGDIRSLDVDGLVVVTDPGLSVDDDLVAIAGTEVADELALIGWSAVGTAVVTKAGQLDAVKNIIHAVSPRWGEESARGKLENVTWACVNVAEENALTSLAIPAISVGTLGYPVEASAKITIARVIDFTFEKTKHLRHILFYSNDETTFSVFRDEFKRQIEDLRETGEGKVRV